MKSIIQSSLFFLFCSLFFLTSCRKAVLIDPSQGGKKWVKVFDDYAIDIFFSDANNGIALSFNSLFITNNGGTNWTKLEGTFDGFNIGMGSPSNFSIVSQNKVMFTKDGGRNFKTYFGDSYSDCFYINPQTCIVNAKKRVWITKDAGATIGINFNQDSSSITDVYAPFKSISSINDNQYWVAKPSGKLYETKNQGLTWFPLSVSSNYFYRIQLLSNGVCYYSDETGLYQSLDGGKTWKSLSVKALDFHFFDAVTGYRAEGGALYLTKDGGENWISVFKINGYVSELFFLNENTGWISTEIGVFKLG